MVKVYSYVMTHDYGFAPNPHGEYCTLACCKPRIRSSAGVDDLVIGTGLPELGPGSGGAATGWCTRCGCPKRCPLRSTGTTRAFGTSAQIRRLATAATTATTRIAGTRTPAAGSKCHRTTARAAAAWTRAGMLTMTRGWTGF